MNDERQRRIWAEHMRDEAGAIRGQQANAGTSHQPVEGPLPYSRDDMTAGSDAAAITERQRCVETAMRFTNEAVLRERFPGWTREQLRDAALLASHIAQALRDDAA